MALLPRRFLCFLLAHHFIVVTACHEASYSQLIQQYCLGQFKLDMEAIGQKLWCDWDETVDILPAMLMDITTQVTGRDALPGLVIYENNEVTSTNPHNLSST
ncbi:receptor activity-modifying protein 1 isoform X4 [Alligator sinensis]|uniref:Receptor activity-modifying protein 1 n=1 Tax=Alligator sinensis TaxID=38654 RepID=A0A3Q0HDD0_ALLSI|nr:receptor activity-modifying protein 1 isoform X4 [Alligator sinensis]